MEHRSAPVNVGEEYDVTIDAVGEKGDGVARVKGFVLFIPGVRAGDRVKVKITKVLQKVGFAEKVGEATTKAEPVAQPEPEQTYEDTEDFGEDSEDTEKTE